jgi:toxin ParE1/3/4
MSAYILTQQAERDLNEIWEHIAGQSIDSADAVLDEIRQALDLVAASPGIGHRRADVRNSAYRFWRANHFIIAYLRDTQPLQIIRVMGGRRDFRGLFSS